MLRATLIAICISLFSIIASAQFTHQQILDLSNSQVKSFLGEHLSEYAHQSEEIRYSYYGEDGKLLYHNMYGDSSMTRGNVHRIYVPYYFAFEFPNYQDTFIHGSFSIELDAQLQVMKKPDLNFIPDFVWTAKKNDFISREKAKETAQKHGLPINLSTADPLNGGLIHAKSGEFVYLFTAMNNDNPPSLSDLWVVNALTGEFIAHGSGEKALKLLLATAVVKPKARR